MIFGWPVVRLTKKIEGLITSCLSKAKCITKQRERRRRFLLLFGRTNYCTQGKKVGFMSTCNFTRNSSSISRKKVFTVTRNSLRRAYGRRNLSRAKIDTKLLFASSSIGVCDSIVESVAIEILLRAAKLETSSSRSTRVFSRLGARFKKATSKRRNLFSSSSQSIPDAHRERTTTEFMHVEFLPHDEELNDRSKLAHIEGRQRPDDY